jgi:hypothetical protein
MATKRIHSDLPQQALGTPRRPGSAEPLRGEPLSAQQLGDLMAELSSTVETVNGRQVKYFIVPSSSTAPSLSVDRFAQAIARACPR